MKHSNWYYQPRNLPVRIWILKVGGSGRYRESCRVRKSLRQYLHQCQKAPGHVPGSRNDLEQNLGPQSNYQTNFVEWAIYWVASVTTDSYSRNIRAASPVTVSKLTQSKSLLISNHFVSFCFFRLLAKYPLTTIQVPNFGISPTVYVNVECR